MLKAYSVISDLNKDACEMIKTAGVQLDISNSNERPDKKKLTELFYKYDILIIGTKEKLTKDMLSGINSKKIIATLSVGLDHIDEQFFNTDLVKIINCPTSNVMSVAEHIFGLILGLNKRIIEANDISINGGSRNQLSMRPHDISNTTIGIIGAGKISREVIKIAKAFNMKILCNTLNPEMCKDLLEQGIIFLSLDEVLANSDIITVNIPLNEENTNLISKDKIHLMKKTATFINTARDKIVDMQALLEYADENSTFKVGLDIDTEDYKELLNKKRNNVIVTPHIAGNTVEAVKRMDIELAKNIKEYLIR